MGLYEMFINNKGRSIHKFPHYFPIYESHFHRYVGKPLVFLEIGSGGGGSSQMWKSYFGPSAQIVTVDIRPECIVFEDDQVKVRIGDQSDLPFLSSIIAEFGAPNIVLDDGSHQMMHIKETFLYMYPRLAPDGIYMIEDLCTAYWPEYGGGFRERSSFLEYCKDLIDEMHYPHTRRLDTPSEIGKTTIGMHFYNSIVAFQRGANIPEHAPIIGDASLYR